MQISDLQRMLAHDHARMPHPFRSAAEMMLTITEELGEVATEVALLERIGTKAEWDKQPRRERLAEEMIHLLNMIFTLANHYQIDLDEHYDQSITSP
jgi:NTP pyrophosphatase (non-canonical NTP hydrolase)